MFNIPVSGSSTILLCGHARLAQGPLVLPVSPVMLRSIRLYGRRRKSTDFAAVEEGFQSEDVAMTMTIR